MTSHRNLAKAFAEGQTKGKGSRMFIDGDTIYSYGHHFPIARRITHNDKLMFLFNSNGYSSSTATHKSYVKSALNEVVEVRNCDKDKVLEQYKKNFLLIADYNLNSKRARTEHKRSYWNSLVSYVERQNELLFDIGLIEIAEGL